MPVVSLLAQRLCSMISLLSAAADNSAQARWCPCPAIGASSRNSSRQAEGCKALSGPTQPSAFLQVALSEIEPCPESPMQKHAGCQLVPTMSGNLECVVQSRSPRLGVPRRPQPDSSPCRLQHLPSRDDSDISGLQLLRVPRTISIGMSPEVLQQAAKMDEPLAVEVISPWAMQLAAALAELVDSCTAEAAAFQAGSRVSVAQSPVQNPAQRLQIPVVSIRHSLFRCLMPPATGSGDFTRNITRNAATLLPTRCGP